MKNEKLFWQFVFKGEEVGVISIAIKIIPITFLKCLLFADDNFFSTGYSSLRADLKQIEKCVLVNKLILNSSKTIFLNFKHPQNQLVNSFEALLINNLPISFKTIPSFQE